MTYTITEIVSGRGERIFLLRRIEKAPATWRVGDLFEALKIAMDEYDAYVAYD